MSNASFEEISHPEETSVVTRTIIPIQAGGSSSNPPVKAGTTQNSRTQPSVSPEPRVQPGDNARRRRLESIVDDFRSGTTSQYAAFSAILQELESEPKLSGQEKDATFGLYCAEVNAAEARGIRPSAGGQRKPSDEPIVPNIVPDKGKTHEKPETFSPGEVDLFEHLSKRSGSDESDIEGDEEGKAHKKPKLLESEMPWTKGRIAEGSATNPSCAKTVKLLKLFNRDVKQARFYVTVGADAPGNIPASQWDRILKGEPVDLDQILSSIHRLTTVDERKAKIGDTEISLGTVDAARKVTTYNEWSIAWRRTARAVSYVFAHRRQELDDYTDYIEGEFEAKQASAHIRVIHYDIAVRNLVCGGQQILLTDTHKFQRLYSANMHSDGIQNTTGPKKPSGSSGGKREICNRFNTGECRSSNCRYRHICKRCGQPGHGQTTCPCKD